MPDNDFPCYNCICVAICKHKQYSTTLEDCSLIRHFINKNAKVIDGDLYVTVSIIDKQLTLFRLMLQSHLHPTIWEVDDKGQFITFRKDVS